MPKNLSDSAIFILRCAIEGYRLLDTAKRLPAYRELSAVGLMELVPGSESEFRFTEDGLRRREAVLEEEGDRLERERYEPPDASALTTAARDLLHRLVSGETIPLDDVSKPTFRELAAARIMIPRSGFATGPESDYQFTYWGWRQRFALAGIAGAKASA
jgi:hypothetical protein